VFVGVMCVFVCSCVGPNILKPVGDRGSVTMENDIGKSNGHVLDDVT